MQRTGKQTAAGETRRLHFVRPATILRSEPNE